MVKNRPIADAFAEQKQNGYNKDTTEKQMTERRNVYASCVFSQCVRDYLAGGGNC